jgi:hypothetical protein
MFDEMLQHEILEGSYEKKSTEMRARERPPMLTIPEYREQFKDGRSSSAVGKDEGKTGGGGKKNKA